MLEQKISESIQKSGLNPKKTAVVATRLKDEKRLVSLNADELLKPASCTKLITTTTALSQLGPNYHFKTEFYSERPPQAGEIPNLYIKGEGDPYFVTEDVWMIARRLRHRGIREISGSLIIDDTYFASQYFPRMDGDNGRAFTAKTSAFSVNFNSVTLRISPGKTMGEPAVLSVEPENNYITLVNNMKTGKKYSIQFDSKVSQGREELTVNGFMPINLEEKTVHRSIEEPITYAGEVFRSVFAQNGIVIKGPVRTGAIPKEASLLLTHESKPLSLIINDINRYSNNFMTEQLLKHLGARFKGAPGTTEKGIQVMADYLRSLGVSPESYELENGSGLSHKNKLSADLLVKILILVQKNFWLSPEILASMPPRQKEEKETRLPFSTDGLFRAKGGTLKGVHCLTGYTPMADGEIAAFAIMTNDTKKEIPTARQAIGRIVSLMQSQN